MVIIYCCWGGLRALQKAHNENRDLPRNFILSTCFVYLLFLFSLFSFSPFLYSLFFIFFCQPLGGGAISPIAPLRFATRFTSQFHSFCLFCLFTFPFFSLFFSFPLFPLFYFIFVSLWGGGAISPIAPPSDSPLDLPRNFLLSTCFVYLLFLFLSFLFLLSSFPSFLFFFSAFGGGRSPPSPPPQIRHCCHISFLRTKQIVSKSFSCIWVFG